MSYQQEKVKISSLERETHLDPIPHPQGMNLEQSLEIQIQFPTSPNQIIIPILEWKKYQRNLQKLECLVFEAVFRQQSLIANWSPNNRS